MRVLLIAALAGCWKPPPQPPSAVGSLPGMRWVTPTSPYRLTLGVQHALVDGATVVVANTAEVVRLDIATGAAIARSGSPGGVLVALAQLRDRRLVALVVANQQITLATIDPQTLAVTLGPVYGQANPTYAGFRIAELPGDAGVLISGPGVPLAIYDAKTFALVRTLDAGLDWRSAVLLERAVVAMREKTVARIDLATGEVTKLHDLSYESHRLTGGGSVYAISVIDGAWRAQIYADGASAPLIVPTGDPGIVSDASGTRLAWLNQRGKLVVQGTTPGSQPREYDAGPGLVSVPRSLKLDGERALIFVGQAVRIVDLAAGTVAGVGAAPYTYASEVLVSGPDSAVAIDSAVYMAEAGQARLVHDADPVNVNFDPGVTELFATVADTPKIDDAGMPIPAVTVYSARDAKVRWTQALESSGADAWLGPAGTVVMSDFGSTVRRVTAKHNDYLAYLTDDASLVGVDFKRSVFYLARGGTIHPRAFDDAMTPSAITLRAPGCSEYPIVITAPDRPQALVIADGGAIVYDLATGKVLGSISSDEDIASAQFIPGTPELFIVGLEKFGVWNPTTGVGAFTDGSDVAIGKVSPDGASVAVALTSGRLALLDMARFRQGLAPGTLAPLAVPTSCAAEDVTQDPPREDDYYPDDEYFDGGSSEEDVGP